MTTTCSIEGCARDAWSRKMCHAHLQKFYRYGDPKAGIELKPSVHGRNVSKAKGYLVMKHKTGSKGLHVMIAEAALGKPLPSGAVVHHVDENKANNAPSNLVICPDRAYHALIHQRMRAYAACGHYDWRKCCRCGVYSPPDQISISGQQAYHAACNAAHVAKHQRKAK